MAGGGSHGIMAAVAVAFLMAACGGPPSLVFEDVPTQIDPRRNYVIFLHGLWVELHGPGAYNDRHGVRYDLDGITKTFSANGLAVIAQVRPRATRMSTFAQTVASQVRTLIGRGAAPERITVVGHSKGGLIALLAASMVANDKVRYVIMAGRDHAFAAAICASSATGRAAAWVTSCRSTTPPTTPPARAAKYSRSPTSPATN
jgi:pimeloyl-ACP methyl ester carboxylesterase